MIVSLPPLVVPPLSFITMVIVRADRVGGRLERERAVRADCRGEHISEVRARGDRERVSLVRFVVGPVLMPVRKLALVLKPHPPPATPCWC